MKTFEFEGSEVTFGAEHATVDKAMSMGFVVGGHCGGLPLACYSAESVSHVEKWRNLTSEERAATPARIVFPTMDPRHGKAILLVKDDASEVFPTYSKGEW